MLLFLYTALARFDERGLSTVEDAAPLHPGACIDLKRRTFDRGKICSEPVRGVAVLTLVYDSFSARSHVQVLDPDTLEPLARIPLTQATPLTFHGSWRPTQGPAPRSR